MSAAERLYIEQVSLPLPGGPMPVTLVGNETPGVVASDPNAVIVFPGTGEYQSSARAAVGAMTEAGLPAVAVYGNWGAGDAPEIAKDFVPATVLQYLWELPGSGQPQKGFDVIASSRTAGAVLLGAAYSAEERPLVDRTGQSRTDLERHSLLGAAVLMAPSGPTSEYMGDTSAERILSMLVGLAIKTPQQQVSNYKIYGVAVPIAAEFTRHIANHRLKSGLEFVVSDELTELVARGIEVMLQNEHQVALLAAKDDHLYRAEWYEKFVEKYAAMYPDIGFENILHSMPGPHPNFLGDREGQLGYAIRRLQRLRAVQAQKVKQDGDVASIPEQVTITRTSAEPKTVIAPIQGVLSDPESNALPPSSARREHIPNRKRLKRAVAALTTALLGLATLTTSDSPPPTRHAKQTTVIKNAPDLYMPQIHSPKAQPHPAEPRSQAIGTYNAATGAGTIWNTIRQDATAEGIHLSDPQTLAIANYALIAEGVVPAGATSKQLAVAARNLPDTFQVEPLVVEHALSHFGIARQ